MRNATIITEFDGTQSENNLVSFFTRADYTLNQKYTFGGSLRTDGSSRFGPNDRWGVFPAVSASWLLSEESWLKGGFFDFLKLRSSLGLTGNQAIDDYPFQGLVGSANYGDEPGIAPDNLPNPDLKWETTAQFNVGVDMAFAKGRVSLSTDWYQKKTSDLLLERPITATSGYTTVFDNVGSVINRGLEIGLTTVNIDSRKTDGFRWTTTLNLGFNRNKVTALFNGQPFSDGIRSLNRVAVGQPIGAFYTLNFLGVDPATGDAIYQDLNGDGSINSDDFTIVGSPHPDYTGGFTSTFSWKGFDLIGFLTFSQGNEVFNAMRIFSDAGGWFLDNQFQDVLDRWQQPGDVTDTPRASYDGASGAAEISSRYMEDGSFWRLQDLTLGYRLPEQWAGRLGFASARFYGSVRNLFTITDYSGYSPDVNSNGSFDSDVGLGTDFYAYPRPAPTASASRPPGSRHRPALGRTRNASSSCARLPARGVAGGLRLDSGHESTGPFADRGRHYRREGRTCRPRGCLQRTAGNLGLGVLLRRGVHHPRRPFRGQRGERRHFRAVRLRRRERASFQQLVRGRRLAGHLRRAQSGQRHPRAGTARDRPGRNGEEPDPGGGTCPQGAQPAQPDETLGRRADAAGQRQERRGSRAGHADAGGGGLRADPRRSRGGRNAGHRDR